MHSLRTECSIRVRMTALLEYIDFFLLNAQKGQIMLQISFKAVAIRTGPYGVLEILFVRHTRNSFRI